jgi:formylglycine-generating enzyme required for sulfatase activity
MLWAVAAIVLCMLTTSAAKADVSDSDIEAAQRKIDALKAKRAAEAATVARKAAEEKRAREEATAKKVAEERSTGGMIVIPAGSFMMGEGSGRHLVTLRSFALGKYDVTFKQWDACVAAGGCNGYRPVDYDWGRGDRPVINVSYDDAQAYIRWISAKTGHAYRLPSEAEWEYAARAGTTTDYYWGTEIGSGHANCDGCGSQWDRKSTSPVGSFPPNPWGLYDMTGNVWQWTADCLNDSRTGEPTDGSAWLSGDCNSHIARGGAWATSSLLVGSPDQTWHPSGQRDQNTGFRLARTLP